MSEPFIFVSHSKIREGKLEEFRSYVREIAKMVETQEPRVIGFHVYANEDGTEVTGVQIHPDAAPMELHMSLLRDKIGQSMQLLEGAGHDFASSSRKSAPPCARVQECPPTPLATESQL
jgi:hypothetical protein